MFDSHRTTDKGDQHFTNEELDGLCLRFYHVPDQGDRTNLFGCELVLPPAVREKINLDWANEDSEQKITMGQLLEVGAVLCKQAQLHPGCVEVTGFDGEKIDVSGIGMEQILDSLIDKSKGLAMEQYEKEKAKGMIPDGMSFDDWIEIAGPDDQALDRMIN